MRYVPLSTIKIHPDRQRQHFDPERLADLQSSIERLGLIQPLVIAEDGTLVAGERRLKSIETLQMLGSVLLFNGELIPDGTVPAILPNENHQLAMFEIELEENIKRHDLTWQEHSAALAKLNQLRSLQALEAGTIPPTVADLALEIEGRNDGAYQDKTRKSLIVSQHLRNPEIAKAKSVDEAFKILKKQEQASENALLATEMGTINTTDRLDAINDDCIEWGWRYIESGGPRYDVICTDPPYGMDAQAFGDGGGSYAGITHNYSDLPLDWVALMNRFAALSHAITKPDAHLYVSCDVDGFPHLKDVFTSAGWRVHRTPLVNFKKDANRVPWPKQGPRRCYELVLYAVKGQKPTTAIYSDVFETTGDDNLGHGAQKPIVFWEELLKRSARPGDRILDPFAGTGGILVAAHKMALRATAIELDKAYYGIILGRLKELS